MGKRKRNAMQGDEELPFPGGKATQKKVIHQGGATPVTIQIVIGTYEKVLHGITASMTSHARQHNEQSCIEFADTFLLNAHTSAIRCLAVSMFLKQHLPFDPQSRFAGRVLRAKIFLLRMSCSSCSCPRTDANSKTYVGFAVGRCF